MAKINHIFTLLLCIFIFNTTLVLARENSKKVRIAVLEFESAYNIKKELSTLLNELTVTQIRQMNTVEVLGFQDIKSLLGFEEEKRLIGCRDNMVCITDIAGSLGADLLLKTNIGKIGRLYTVVFTLIDIRRAAIKKKEARTFAGDEELLVNNIKEMLLKVFDKYGKAKSLPDFQASREPRTFTRWYYLGFSGLLALGGGGLLLAAEKKRQEYFEDNNNSHAVVANNITTASIVAFTASALFGALSAYYFLRDDSSSSGQGKHANYLERFEQQSLGIMISTENQLLSPSPDLIINFSGNF